jgi:hypothetical protein
MIMQQLPPAGVDQTSYWPYAISTAPRMAYLPSGGWFLAMSASGHCIVWNRRSSERLPDGFIGFAQTKTKQDALKFLTTFCSLGYEKRDAQGQVVLDPHFKYQSGREYRFNWVSGTVAQVYVASQITKRFLDGDWDGAWQYGKNFEAAIERALITGSEQ